MWSYPDAWPHKVLLSTLWFCSRFHLTWTMYTNSVPLISLLYCAVTEGYIIKYRWRSDLWCLSLSENERLSWGFSWRCDFTELATWSATIPCVNVCKNECKWWHCILCPILQAFCLGHTMPIFWLTCPWKAQCRRRVLTCARDCSVMRLTHNCDICLNLGGII